MGNDGFEVRKSENNFYTRKYHGICKSWANNDKRNAHTHIYIYM